MTISGRELARRVLRRVEREGAFASLALGGELSRAGLAPPERRLATELVYGVLRHRSRLDRAVGAHATRGLGKLPPPVRVALRVAAYQILFLDRVPAHAAVSDAVSAARGVAGPRVGGFVNGVLRALAAKGEPPLPEGDLAARIQVETSTPPWLYEQLARRLPEDALGDAARALCEPAPLWLRANPRRGAAEVLAESLAAEGADVVAEASRLCPGALAVRGLGSPERSPSIASGAFTVQDLGAQLVGWMVAPEARRVLDACAGVGGKATHLAERLGDGARIDAADLSATKLELLGASAARLGLGGIRPLQVDVTAPGDALGDAYDAVVLDAPCSGLGVLRRHPERKWRPPDEGALVDLQRRMLEVAAARVRPGGELVYSVCTFADAEGPAQVDAFLAAHPDFARAAPTATGPRWDALLDDRGQLVTWPHRHGADAFFAVRLVKRTAP